MKKIAVPTLVFIFIFGVLFFLTSAVSVQSGDTGELVTNSYFLRVSHAPGYPLWTLLYHLPVKYLGGGNPFQAASLFTVGITLAWMGGLLWLFKGWESFLIVAVLATNITVWRYAVLPDVFSLHLLFLFLVSIVFHRPAAIKNPLLLFLISLSVSHHHTIVFAFPLFLYAFHRERSLRLFGLSLLFGILSFSIYLSLLAFHPQDYGSFGDLRSILDVVNHFLRKDYGTLKLMAREDAGSSSWGLFFLETFIKDSWSILVAILYVTFRHGPQLKSLRPKLAILGLSLVLYILVFSVMGKISLSVGSEGVFERFLLQPTFLVFLLALMVFSSEGVKLPRWLLLLFVVNTGVNSVTNYKLADYRSNTFIEDYLLNGLNSLPKNSVLYTYGDNIGFGMYYVKDVRKVRPDVTHIHPSFGFDWGVEKTIRKYPDLFIDQKKGFPEGFNFEKYRFFTNLQIDSLPKGYQVSYAGLFFEVAPAKGKEYQRFQCEILGNLKWRNRPKLEDFRYTDVSRYFDLTYGNCYFVKGLELLREGDLVGASEALELSTEISPYNPRYKERLCFVYEQLNRQQREKCTEELDQLLEHVNDQYLVLKQ